MLADFPGSTAVLIGALLAPASFVWWFGRTLARTPEDPLLPERLLAWRRRSRVVLAASWALMAALASARAMWCLPLMMLLRGAAAHPLRRALQGETWSIHQYLWFFFRLTVALYGFWLLLVQTPGLILSAGKDGWWVGALLAVALWSWSARYGEVISFLMRARPAHDRDLLDRFRHIADRAGIEPPAVEIIEMNGGVLANALALPSPRRPLVLMSSTLLERFDRDEIVAVYAHELAHVEHYNSHRMRRMNVANRALIVAAVLSGLAVSIVDSVTAASMSSVWFVAVVVILTWRARSKQKEETASDLRAIALTGQPEALVTALAKLHTIGRVPRRWEPRIERHATHPSLARRIQAIRSAAGHVRCTLASPAAFACGATALVLHDDRLMWTEGGVATHSFPYAHLTELRLDVKHRGAPRLVAVERSGRRWETPIAVEDVSRLQSALDAVDVQLAAGAPPPTAAVAPVRLLCAAVALLAVSGFQFAVLIPTALAVLQPAPALMAATGAAAVSASMLLWFGRTVGTGWYAPALAASGCALLFMAWLSRKDQDQPNFVRPIAALSIGVVGVWAILLSSGANAIQLHQTARDTPAAATLTFSLASALVMLRSRRARTASVLLALAAMTVVLFGSRAYLERFGSDPFLASAERLTVHTEDGPVIAATPILQRPTQLRVSPGGKSVAFASYSSQKRQTFYSVGRPAGPFTTLPVDSLLFVDDDHALVLESGSDSVIIREVSLDEPTVAIWEHRIANGRRGRLALNAQTRQWRVIGQNRDSEIIRVDGRIGDSNVDEQRWPDAADDDDDDDDFVDAISASASRVLMRRTHYTTDGAGGRFDILPLLVGPTSTQSDFWTLGPGGAKPFGATRLDVDCDWAYGPNDRPVCLAFDGWKTTLFSFDLASGRLEPMHAIEGAVTFADDGGSGWISGWWNDSPIAVRIDGREAVRVTPPDGGYIASIAAADRAIATVAIVGHESVLRVHRRLPAASAASR